MTLISVALFLVLLVSWAGTGGGWINSLDMFIVDDPLLSGDIFNPVIFDSSL
jgi:hypothetical protein